MLLEEEAEVENRFAQYHYIFGRRRYIGRVAGPAAADSVLTFSELPRLCVAAAPLRQKNLVDFPNETK